MKTINTKHLNPEEHKHVLSLIKENYDLFHLPGEALGKTDAITHKIPTTNDTPINVKQYRCPPIHKEEINKQMKELLDSDIVRPSKSPYNSPLWIVPKKPDEDGNKRWRMVIDYRALNEKSIADAYSLPSILEILDQLGSAKYFSVFDLASGFHQIGLEAADAEKTAFSTPYGHYEFARMPFGLKNAPATFQRLMDSVLSGLQGNELFVYLDDIVIYASSLSEHKYKFNKLAERLRRANLKLQSSKCGFLHHEVAYLGHVIGETGVRSAPEKVAAVKKFPTPKNTKNIREFLGLAGYYRRFIDKFSQISKPLESLLRKDVKFIWEKDQQRAFDTLRTALCSEPLLQYPDFQKQFNITTDASGYALGAVLSQGEIASDKPIAYASRLLQGAEINYSTIEKECLAIIYAVQHFRPYIYGRRFNLITDHRPLVWMNSVKDPTSRPLRWRLKLTEYDYKIIYKAGKQNTNADALSRNPVSIFPLSSDSSDAPLFIPSSQRQMHPQPNNSPPIPSTHSPQRGRIRTPSPGPSSRHSLSPKPVSLPASPASTTRPDAARDTDDSSNDEIILPPQESPTRRQHQTITHTRDRLIMRRDNIACFTTQD
ncbi:Retrovirus-related Pol polyprotein from transposon 17.6 [Anthophora quadrimaculata]